MQKHVQTEIVSSCPDGECIIMCRRGMYYHVDGECIIMSRRGMYHHVQTENALLCPDGERTGNVLSCPDEECIILSGNALPYPDGECIIMSRRGIMRCIVSKLLVAYSGTISFRAMWRRPQNVAHSGTISFRAMWRRPQNDASSSAPVPHWMMVVVLYTAIMVDVRLREATSCTQTTSRSSS